MDVYFLSAPTLPSPRPPLEASPANRSARRPTKGERTQARILEAAEEVFSRHGLEGARVREIARAAGVTAANLYNYFPSKEALHEAVLERGLGPLIELMEPSRAEQSLAPGDEIWRGVQQHLAAHPHLSRLIFLEIAAEGPHAQQLSDRWLRPLHERILGFLAATGGSGWAPALWPEVSAAFIELFFGHFALAPLLARLDEGSPLEDAALERRNAFFAELIGRMFAPSPAA